MKVLERQYVSYKASRVLSLVLFSIAFGNFLGVEKCCGFSRPRSNILIIYDALHVISLTRPSRFSACNIEKLGIGPGDEAKKGYLGPQEVTRIGKWLPYTGSH